MSRLTCKQIKKIDQDRDQYNPPDNKIKFEIDQYDPYNDRSTSIYHDNRGCFIIDGTRRRKAILNDIEKQIMRDS